jgi:outer membrane protein, heavy metal efflux system
MRVVCGFVIAALCATSALAQAPDRVSLHDLIVEVQEKNPAIAAAARRFDAARQRPAQERSLPDPMVSAGYVANGRPWPGAGLGTEPTSNIGFMVTQELPYSGKRERRASIAARDGDAERQQIEAARLGVTARVKQAYYRLAYTYAVGDVLTRNLDLLGTLLEVSRNRYAVGQAAQQDVIKAQTQLSIIELRLERTRQERAAREGELNALLARRPASPVGQPDDLQMKRFDVSLESLVAMVAERAPLLRRDQIMIDRAQLAVDAAREDYKPDFAITGGYAYMGSMPAMYEARFDVRIPLQRTRRAAAVAERLALVEQARSAYDATRLDLQNRIQEDYQTATTAVRLARLYGDTVLPQARLALESSLASYQTGRVDFLSVLTNFGTLLDYEMTYFDELVSFHGAVSRLEEMIAAELAD